MAKKKKTITKTERKPRFQKIKSFFGNRQTQTIIGSFTVLFAVFLLISFFSYFFNWQEDQSQLADFSNKNSSVKNLLGKIGATISHFFIYDGFGISSIYNPFLLFFSGIAIFLKGSIKQIKKNWGWGILAMVWLSVAIGFISSNNQLLPGIIGYELNSYLQQFLGKMCLLLVLLFLLISYLVIRFKFTPEKIKSVLTAKKVVKNSNKDTASEIIKKPLETVKATEIKEKLSTDFELPTNTTKPASENQKPKETAEKVTIDVEKIVEETHVEENMSSKLVKDFGEFDPTLELANYSFPTLNLLKDYDESISIDQEELEGHKNRIVETLNNYNIGIARIKATVGPTVTLYEIVPDAGIRISKIKNLEDDIALSLSAMGIRIIAPIP